MKYPFEEEIKAAAEKYNLNPNHVAAHCFVESSFDRQAYKYEPDFQKRYINSNPRYAELTLSNRTLLASSLGIMQVMGVVAVELGMKPADMHNLMDLVVGLDYGCKHLSRLLKRYTNYMPDAIAAYNAGSVRKNKNGAYVNQNYVDKVINKFHEYEG